MRFFISAICVLVLFSYAGVAYDHNLDPNANITIKWDVIQWTPDGYVFRQIAKPGWKLNWTWTNKEVIWNILGAQTIEQGGCSRFKGNKPVFCKKIPVVVDRLPGVPINQQVANCCRGGVVAALGQSAFQITVGEAGNTVKTVRLPQNFTLLAPGAGYTCGATRIVPSTIFITPRGKIPVWSKSSN
ncbi:hypothetical protein TSUD_168530 [Trifolium subterraneum]|nr:hypothetical protein TSUD_168530 [Trifolium subterraneum]